MHPSKIAAIFGALMTFGGCLFTIGGMLIAADGGTDFPPPERTIEGIVISEAAAQTPLGMPAVYGEISLSARSKSKGGPVPYELTRIADFTFGSPEVTLDTANGPQTITLPRPKTGWKGKRWQEERLRTLHGMPWATRVPKWREFKLGFIVRQAALRQGDYVVAETKGSDIVSVWIGTKDEVLSRSQLRQAGSKQMFLYLAIAFFILAGLSVYARYALAKPALRLRH